MTADLSLPKYDRHQSYDWNYDHPPVPVDLEVPALAGDWTFCGLSVESPLGISAGPLLNGRWCLYYASLGFDVVTYKTVRSSPRDCYAQPNLQPVDCPQICETADELRAVADMKGSWAVSYGMPSATPASWREDVESTRRQLPANKLLSVSVVATVQDSWTLDRIAADYAQCARWAVEAGADVIETNFSCPNVSTCDGQLYQHPNDAGRVAEEVRQAIGAVPWVAKIGHVPNTEAASELLTALSPWVDGLAMTNSVATRVRSGETLLFDGERRGICGAAILDASVSQTEMFAKLVREQEADVRLIGVGGVSRAEDVRRYLSVGAECCHLATAAMVRPDVAIEIRRELQAEGFSTASR